MMKRIVALSLADLEAHPVWRFAGSESDGEVLVSPIKSVPVSNLTNKFVATQIRLANGRRVWATVGNVDVRDPAKTRHFLTLSVLKRDRWFHLARYHDLDYATRGPRALAKFLGLKIREVFPISFDLRLYVKGDPAALIVTVPSKPKRRLT